MNRPEHDLTPWPTVALILGGLGLFVLMLVYAPGLLPGGIALFTVFDLVEKWCKKGRKEAVRPLLFLAFWIYFTRELWLKWFGL